MRIALAPLAAVALVLAVSPVPAGAQGIISGNTGGDEFGAGLRGVGDL
ncbi:MAG: hypothetical protein FD129_2591, partial [bacterium]